MPFLCVKGKEGWCFGGSNCYCPLLCCEVPPGLETPPANHTRMFKVPIKQACSGESFGWWCCGCCCPACAAFGVRTGALGGNLDNYTCCQGYFQDCIYPGTCCEGTCPCCCLCLEAFLCTTCSMSATRMFLMDKHGLTSDPSDYQSIRINNTFALARLVTYPLGMFQSLAFIPNIAALAAAVTFCQTIGGMNLQMMNEIQYQAGNGSIQSNAPTYEVIGGRIV